MAFVHINEYCRLQMEFYKISAGSDKIKRVVELCGSRDVAESVGNTDKVKEIDAELANIGGANG